MSRLHPTECEHGVIVDWGDFAPTHGGTPRCSKCDEAQAALAVYITDRDDTGAPLGRLVAVFGDRLYRVELAPHLEVKSLAVREAT